MFAELTRLLERGGNIHGGSLTLIATVLSDGADEREPLSDAARATLDGHIALCTKRARAGLFPAIDVVASASRTMDAVAPALHRKHALTVRRAIAQLEATRELRELGFLHPDRGLERVVALQEHLEAFVHHGTRTYGPGESSATLPRLRVSCKRDCRRTRMTPSDLSTVEARIAQLAGESRAPARTPPYAAKSGVSSS